MTFYLSAKLSDKKFCALEIRCVRHIIFAAKRKKYYLTECLVSSHGNGNGLAENEWKLKMTGGNLFMAGEINNILDENMNIEILFRSKQFHQGPGCDDDSESLG